MYTHRVEEWMTAPPIVIAPTTSLEEAQRLMDQHGVRRLPVVDAGRLVGIVTRGDLRAAQPSHATTLSVFEWRTLLSQVTVAECMTHNPVMIAPDASALAAAELMLARKIGGLPVVQGERVVGVISESDLLRLLIADETRFEELMIGAR
jgi:CBS domain-containing protein